MPGFMKWGSDFFESCRRTELTQTVNYKPIGEAFLTVPATFARTEHRTRTESDVLVRYEIWEFQITRSDLAGRRPQIGDEIYYTTEAGETFRYDVVQTEMGVFRDHDRFKDTIVIFTSQYQIDDELVPEP